VYSTSQSQTTTEYHLLTPDLVNYHLLTTQTHKLATMRLVNSYIQDPSCCYSGA